MQCARNGYNIIGFCYGSVAHSSRSNAHETFVNCLQTAPCKTFTLALDNNCNALHEMLAKNETVLKTRSSRRIMKLIYRWQNHHFFITLQTSVWNYQKYFFALYCSCLFQFIIPSTASGISLHICIVCVVIWMYLLMDYISM